MQQQLYPDNWKERVQEADLRAGGRCERCGAVLGTLRVSRKRNLYFLPLHTSHVNHDPENPQAEIEKLCPSCHGKSHPWLPGTPTKERPYGYQPVTLARVLRAARAGGLEISPQETGVCWSIASLSGQAPDVLDAISQALHCLRMDRLAWREHEEGGQHD
jgi:hypothetical protein